MKKIVCAVVAASALFAGQADYNWEITPTVSGVVPEGNLGVKNHYAVGMRLASNLETALINQVEFGFDFSGQTKLKNGETSDAARYFLDINKDFLRSGKFSLYGLAGMGYETWSKEYKGAIDGVFGQYGLGAKYYVTDNFALRLEARDEIKLHKADHNFFYTLGFAVDFGKKAAPIVETKPVVEAKPAPVVAPAPVEKISVAVVQDDDHDGVPNNLDKCPNTPAGVVVDANGCEKVIHLELGVNFAFNSAKINPNYMSEIKKVADVMSAHKNYSVLLDGYTDSTGPASYNLILSKRRADSVAKALETLGVSANKITTKGYGEADPIATNKTKAGRAKNRRVDAKFRY